MSASHTLLHHTRARGGAERRGFSFWGSTASRAVVAAGRRVAAALELRGVAADTPIRDSMGIVGASHTL